MCLIILNKTFVGNRASLLITEEAEFRTISPYNADEDASFDLTQIAVPPVHKFGSTDIFWLSNHEIIAFWCDHYNKKVQSFKFYQKHRHHSREIEAVNTLLIDLHDPRALAVDWITHKLYIIDTGAPAIVVSSLQGENKVTLIHKDLEVPNSIALEPSTKTMIWSNWGLFPKIETAYMDGSYRNVLVDRNVQAPTSLVIDYPSQRLYWVDIKLQIIDSILLNGLSRKVAKKFARSKFF